MQLGKIDCDTTNKFFGHRTPSVKPDAEITNTSEVIDDSFFSINFIINKKLLKVTVDELIQAKYTSLKELTDEAINSQLEKLNAWRHTFNAALEELAEQRELKEQQLNSWLGEIRESVIDYIIKWRVKTIRDNPDMPKGWFGSITKEEISQVISSNPRWSETFISKNTELLGLRKNEAILRDLIDNIKNRSFTLRYIGEYRLASRKQV